MHVKQDYKLIDLDLVRKIAHGRTLMLSMLRWWLSQRDNKRCSFHWSLTVAIDNDQSFCKEQPDVSRKFCTEVCAVSGEVKTFRTANNQQQDICSEASVWSFRLIRTRMSLRR